MNASTNQFKPRNYSFQTQNENKVNFINFMLIEKCKFEEKNWN